MNRDIIQRIIEESAHKSAVHPKDRFVETEEDLLEAVRMFRESGLSIVLTQGTFDLFHIGHNRYLKKARSHGDVLIVGVDDDAKARGRKGENRPVVPLSERMEILAHTANADIVVVKRKDDKRWQLIKLILPDVLIAVEGTYTEEEVEQLKEFATSVVVLKRQAETSTSAKVRTLILDGAETLTGILSVELPEKVAQSLREMLPEAIASVYRRLKESEK